MILVTGATGTVGSEVVRQLVASGERPRAFVRDPRTAREMLGPGVDYVAGDLDRPETLPVALTGVDRVFLLTRQSSRQLIRSGPSSTRRCSGCAPRGEVVGVPGRRPVGAPDRPSACGDGAVRRAVRFPCTFVRPLFFMQNLVGQALNGAIPRPPETGVWQWSMRATWPRSWSHALTSRARGQDPYADRPAGAELRRGCRDALDTSRHAHHARPCHARRRTGRDVAGRRGSVVRRGHGPAPHDAGGRV